MSISVLSGKGLLPLFAIFAQGSVLAAAEPPIPTTSGALLQGLLGLGMVLAVLAAFFWFLRRFSPGQNAAQGAVKVVGGVMLGPRERLVVVEVGETWLLLGVGGGQVNALHSLPRPEGYTPAVAPPRGPDFAGKLKELLSKRQA
jgi:flagellar protein FliO/FliZ